MRKDVRKSKPSHLNRPPIVKQNSIKGRKQTNPISKSPPRSTARPKNPQTNQSKGSSVRLPPISKPSTTQVPSKANPPLLPSAYTQTTRHHFEKPSTTTTTITTVPVVALAETERPTPIKPYLPLIKEKTIEKHLGQKSTLKCKSPRPGTALSRSTHSLGAELYPATQHRPLQHMDVGALLSDSARHRLKKLFRKLDTDQDGHLNYSQVQRCLPSTLPRAQVTFFHLVYEILSDATFFGIQEFYAMAVIVEIIAKQDPTLWTTLLDDVDFNHYHDRIIDLIDEFNDHCLSMTSCLSFTQFLEILQRRLRTTKVDRLTTEIEYFVPMIRTMKINRLEFIALLPLTIYLESFLHRERTLFRFREHSILDLHLRQALMT